MADAEMNENEEGKRGGTLSVARFALPLLLLVVWDLLSRAGFVNSLFLPSPSIIVESIWSLIRDDALLANLADTLMRLGTGFVLGSVCGVLLALLMVGFDPLGRALDPIIGGLYAVPKVAFLPMLVIWVGIGEAAKVSLIAVGAFFPVLINIYIGSRRVPPVLLRAARNLGAGEWQVLFRVVLPALLPEMFAGLKLGFGVALTLTVYAEMIGVGSGVGFLTQNSAQLFELGKAYGALVILIAIAVGAQAMLAFAQAKICRWQQDHPTIAD